MAGISSKALNFGEPENKYKFNGIEQNTDFDLNMYDAQYRNLDPQIGRFWQVDPESDNLESYSPYESMGNNPISYADPLGDFRTRFGAWWDRLWNGGGEIAKNEFGEWYVERTRTEAMEDGNAAIVSYRYYGKGRNQYTSAGEDIRDEQERQADIDHMVKLGVYQRVNTQREANEGNLKAFVGVLLPNVTKAGTFLANFESAADKIKKFLNAGRQPSKGGLLTAAGRALQKHFNRAGSLFQKVKGNEAAINAEAEKVLEAILKDPNVTVSTRHHGSLGYITEYKLPNGQGARFAEDGSHFWGFLEPGIK
jgi:RHS repeat-associated protein